MAVVGVCAQTDVGHDDQVVAEVALQTLAGFLHGAVRGRGRGAVGRLAAVLGMAEQQHGANAELQVLTDLLHDVLEALLRDAGHRRDRLVGAPRRQHEVRHDQLLGADRGFGDEIAQRSRAAQPPEPGASRSRDDQFCHCMASKIPFKLGLAASAVTARPCARAAAEVDGPIVKMLTGMSMST